MKIVIDGDKRKSLVHLFTLLKKWKAPVLFMKQPDRCVLQLVSNAHDSIASVVFSKEYFAVFDDADEVSFSADIKSVADAVIKSSCYDCVVLEYNDTDNMLTVSGEAVSEPDVRSVVAQVNISCISDKKDPLNMNDTNDWQVEGKASCAELCSCVNTLNKFGKTLIVKCGTNEMELLTKNNETTTRTVLTRNVISEYTSRTPRLSIQLSLEIMVKYCLSNKLTKTMTVCLKPDFPVRLQYVLLDETCTVDIYIMPVPTDENVNIV